MKKIRVEVSTSIYGSKVHEEFEVEDNCTEEEIEEELQNCVWDRINVYWEEIK